MIETLLFRGEAVVETVRVSAMVIIAVLRAFLITTIAFGLAGEVLSGVVIVSAIILRSGVRGISTGTARTSAATRRRTT